MSTSIPELFSGVLTTEGERLQDFLEGGAASAFLI